MGRTCSTNLGKCVLNFGVKAILKFVPVSTKYCRVHFPHFGLVLVTE
jgi:hypothetical protein